MAMLLRIGRLLRKVRPEGRREELSDLIQRQRNLEPSTTPTCRALAIDLLTLKAESYAATRETASCGRCRHAEEGDDGYQGGFCCGASSAEVFSDGDLLALQAAGVELAPLLEAPRFREPRPKLPTGADPCALLTAEGCGLEPAHRPVICVAYACRGLRRELGATRGAAFGAAAEALEEGWEAFLDLVDLDGSSPP
ncbi:MAG: hypothetical protein AAGF12_22170 [Myxococcota bacterium]